MKALDSWARQFGYADFDTYIRAGNSVLTAAQDIAKRIRTLSEAMKALPLDQITKPPVPHGMRETTSAVTLEEAKAIADRGVQQIIEPLVSNNPYKNPLEDSLEPPDPDNAQIQGAEHRDP